MYGIVRLLQAAFLLRRTPPAPCLRASTFPPLLPVNMPIFALSVKREYLGSILFSCTTALLTYWMEISFPETINFEMAGTLIATCILVLTSVTKPYTTFGKIIPPEKNGSWQCKCFELYKQKPIDTSTKGTPENSKGIGPLPTNKHAFEQTE